MISRVAIARAVAIGADALQLGLFPAFAPGVASVFDVALDVAVCGVMTWLVGWNIAFLPSFLLEGIPFADLAPTWTLAAIIATRKKKQLPPPPLPEAGNNVPPRIQI